MMLTLLSSCAGHFWQLTDLHWDQQYRTDGDPGVMCHSNEGQAKLTLARDSDNMTAGQYGTYSCDAPWDLIEFSIRGMAEHSAFPDFIIWTGYVGSFFPPQHLGHDNYPIPFAETILPT